MIFPMKTAKVPSSLRRTKQFSVMTKIGQFANLVPLQKDCAVGEGVTP